MGCAVHYVASFSTGNSPLFAHATFYEQNSFECLCEKPRFTTNSFLLTRSRFFVKPKFWEKMNFMFRPKISISRVGWEGFHLF